MARNSKSSSGGGSNLYNKGYRFWANNRFWDSDLYSKSAKDYFENWLESLRANERQLTRLNA
jgi:hypothetical protein